MVDIEIQKISDVFIINPNGEIDASSSIYLDNALVEGMKNNYKKILVDFSKLTYISSAGLGVFISHLEEFETANIELILTSLNDSVEEVFNILGLQKLIKITKTKEEGINAFDGA